VNGLQHAGLSGLCRIEQILWKIDYELRFVHPKKILVV